MTGGTGPGPTTGTHNGAQGSVTGGGSDAKAVAADLGSDTNSAPPALLACSDALHKVTAVVISIGAGAGMVVVVVETDTVQVMGDASLVSTAAGFPVSAADVDETAAGEDDIRGTNDSTSISRKLKSSLPLVSPFFTGEYCTHLLGLTSSSRSLHSKSRRVKLSSSIAAERRVRCCIWQFLGTSKVVSHAMD